VQGRAGERGVRLAHRRDDEPLLHRRPPGGSMPGRRPRAPTRSPPATRTMSPPR
jgi:hypothetical protein